MLRTQIYLPEQIRQEADLLRKASGESLAEYVRQAMKDRIKKDKRRKTDLKKIADAFVGSSKKSDKEIQQWLDWVRKERRLSDEVREERLQKALKRK